jgi:hypothetical protein
LGRRRLLESEARERLARAQSGSDRVGGKLGWEQRFGALALEEREAGGESLRGRFRVWPTYLYRDLPGSIRVEILDWLVANAQHISALEVSNGWWEQWQLARLAEPPLDPNRVLAAARVAARRPYSVDSRRLFEHLRLVTATPEVTLCWLEHLRRAGRWDDLVAEAGACLSAIAAGSAVRGEVYLRLVEGLLGRGNPARHGRSDAEVAFHVLQAAAREGVWSAAHERELHRTVESLLPAELTEGRGRNTSLPGEVCRSVLRIGGLAGIRLGGRDAALPRSEDVIGSAPRLLCPGKVEGYLDGSPRLGRDFRASTALVVGEWEAAVTGGTVSLGAVWTLSRIDGTVLDALSFSSSGQPDSFWTLREVAGDTIDRAGAVTRLQGYVAEQQVALDLAREGHQVEFPAGPGQAGWDLLVDGQPVQVKCTLDADAVMEHFDRYPNIPVVVNAELADQLGEHPLVFVDYDMSHADVVHSTGDSLDAITDFADADDLLPIPLTAIAFASLRNYRELRTGRTDGWGFARRTGIDAALRTAGGGAGSTIGGLVGSLLGPVGAIVGLGIGGFLGSVAGGRGADAVNRASLCDARDRAVAELGDFATWFRAEALARRIGHLKRHRTAVATWASRASAGDWAPTVVPTIFAVAVEEESRAEALDAWLSERLRGDDFARANAGWVALREVGVFIHPELKTRLARVKGALDSYSDLANPSAAHGARELAPA